MLIAKAQAVFRARLIYFLFAVIVVLAGLASRRYGSELPEFLSEYAGDTLWALMLFLLVSSLLASRPMLARTAISLGLAFLIETGQLYHEPWIDSIRRTTLGGLILGFGFLWTDLACYLVGIAFGMAFELAIAARIHQTKGAAMNTTTQPPEMKTKWKSPVSTN